MINDPQQLEAKYQETFALIGAYNVPKDLEDKITRAYTLWANSFMFQPWGFEKGATWSVSERDKWNNNYAYFEMLVKTVIDDPRTTKRVKQIVKVTPTTPVQKGETIFITGQAPKPEPAPAPTFNYWWLVGGAAALGAIALLLGKKTTQFK